MQQKKKNRFDRKKGGVSCDRKHGARTSIGDQRKVQGVAMGSPTGEPDTQTAGGCKRLAQTWKLLKPCLALLVVCSGGYRRGRRIFYEICAPSTPYRGKLSLTRSLYSGSSNLHSATMDYCSAAAGS